MKFLSVLLIFLLGGTALAQTSQLNNVIFKNVSVKNDSLVNLINKIQQALEPTAAKGVKIRLIENPDSILGFKRQVLPKPLDNRRGFSEASISFNIDNVPALQLITIAALSSGAAVYIKDEEVYVYPNVGTFESYSKATFFLPKISGVKDEYIDYRGELVKQGVVFYEGSSARYYRRKGRLEVVNTSEQIDNINAITN